MAEESGQLSGDLPSPPHLPLPSSSAGYTNHEHNKKLSSPSLIEGDSTAQAGDVFGEPIGRVVRMKPHLVSGGWSGLFPHQVLNGRHKWKVSRHCGPLERFPLRG